jgi:two-component system cell cycle response regulator DivK
VTEVPAPTHTHVGLSQEKQLTIPSTSSTRKRRALVVNTDPVSTRLCRETLERLGFTIERVDSGVAAVVAARSQTPDLVLMDLQLRDVTAAETIGWLRSNQALKSVPIIVLGITDGSQIPAKNTSGIAGIAKPLSTSAIERTLRDLCG